MSPYLTIETNYFFYIFTNYLTLLTMEENLTVDPKDAQDNKIMAILAYLGFLVLVPIFAAKESRFARFHANQGLVLCIAAIAVYFVLYILMFILALITPALALLTLILTSLVWVGVLVFMVIGIINVTKGEMKELPIIGKYKLLK